ncbi:hypothetical protein [Streptomyces sp. B6B3]|jgi:hypothetical protein|uniref:hypothetical protein n=1 Tax=Streptomyces sp. B6B3 TaxID=3153570 RepID=UPI00325E90EF
MILFLLLLLVAIVLGIIGIAADGLTYLLFIGIAVLVADLALGILLLRRSGRTPTR